MRNFNPNAWAPVRGFDPQNAPDTWEREVERVTDVEGNEWVVLQDQDGVEYLVDAFNYDHPGDL